MRVLAIDFGRKRVGLALSDPSFTVASPHPPIVRKGSSWWDELLGLIERESVSEIVVGLPRNLDGSESQASQVCRKFAEELERRSSRPIHLLDERLSSVAASASLRESGLRQREQRGKVDSVAASLLLQVYLQRRQGGNSPVG